MSESIAAQSFFVAIEDNIRPGDRIIVVNNVVVAVQRGEASTPRITSSPEPGRSTGINGQDMADSHFGSRALAYGTADTLPLRLDVLRAISKRPGFLVASYLDTELRIDPASPQRIAARTVVAQMKNQGLLTHHREDASRSRQRLLLTPKGRALLDELDKQ